MTLTMTYNECPSSAIIVTLWSLLTYNRCEVVMSSLWGVLRKYQEVSYLHAKKISIIIITVTKIVPSPTGELSFNKKRFPPGLYKFSDDNDWRTRIFIMIKSNPWKHVASRAKGVMCHWCQMTVITYDTVPMTHAEWPQNGHYDIIYMPACSSRYCGKGELWLWNEAWGSCVSSSVKAAAPSHPCNNGNEL